MKIRPHLSKILFSVIVIILTLLLVHKYLYQLSDIHYIFNIPRANIIVTRDVKPYETVTLRSVPNLSFILIKNNDNVILDNLPVINNHNWNSLRAITQEITRSDSTVEQKANSIYNFIKEYYYQDYPPVNEWFSHASSPLQMLHSWGYGACGNSSLLFVTMASLVEIPGRVVSLSNHVVSELYYDNDWHMYDVDRHVVIKLKNGVASVNDIFNNLNLLSQAKYEQKFLHQAYSPKIITSIVASKDMPANFYNENYLVELLSHASIIWFIDWKYKYFSSYEPKRIIEYSNGVITNTIPLSFNIFKEIQHKNIKRDVIINSFYPLVDLKITSPLMCLFSKNVFISTNYSDWVNARNYCQSDIVHMPNLLADRIDTQPIYKIYLKIPFVMPPINIYSVFQYSPKFLADFINLRDLSISNLSNNISVTLGGNVNYEMLKFMPKIGINSNAD